MVMYECQTLHLKVIIWGPTLVHESKLDSTVKSHVCYLTMISRDKGFQLHYGLTNPITLVNMERNIRWNYKWAIWSFVVCCQACSQIMNTVSAADSSAGAYMYLRLYTHIMQLYCMQLYCVYVLFMHKRKKRLCQGHKLDTNYAIAWYRIFYACAYYISFAARTLC